MKTRTTRRDKVNVITLGCSKNLVDSENLITQLRGNDFEVEHDGQGDGANLGLRMDGRRGGFHGIVSRFPGRVVAKAVAGKSWRPGPGPGHR